MATDKSFGCRFANTEKCADSCFKCELFHRDYISRDKAANVLCTACGNAACDPFECSFYKEMEDIPAADVRPVVPGEWIVDSIASNIFTCSVCGQDAPVEPTGGTEYKSNFCPNCGADMREDRNGTP